MALIVTVVPREGVDCDLAADKREVSNGREPRREAAVSLAWTTAGDRAPGQRTARP